MLRPPAAAAAGAADGVKGLCVEGEVRPPGSKSISNRILMLAGVAEGTCRVKGLLHSDDTQVMMGALQQLGASFEWEDNGDTLVVHGTGGAFRTPTQVRRREEREEREERQRSEAACTVTYSSMMFVVQTPIFNQINQHTAPSFLPAFVSQQRRHRRALLDHPRHPRRHHRGKQAIRGRSGHCRRRKGGGEGAPSNGPRRQREDERSSAGEE